MVYLVAIAMILLTFGVPYELGKTIKMLETERVTMIDPAFSKKVLSLIMSFLMEFGSVGETVPTAAQTQPTITEITAENLAVSTISVSCLKVTWTDKPDRDYTISCKPHDSDYAYSDNIYFHFKEIIEICFKG